MLEFVLRFLGGGLLVASIPLVAARYGSAVAGLLLLFPAVSLAGFVVLGTATDAGAVQRAALGSLAALPVVAVFLLCTHLAARSGAGVAVSLLVGVGGWLVGAAIFLGVRHLLLNGQ